MDKVKIADQNLGLKCGGGLQQQYKSTATALNLQQPPAKVRSRGLEEGEFKRAARYQSSLSCMVIDIDHFKTVNDSYGHQTGDIVLKEVAHVIQTTLREVDTPARWGGEEFIALSPNTTRENAIKAAERIRKAVASHKFAGIGDRQITVSIGVAGMPDPALDSLDKLIHAADVAMYEAKKNGRNRVEPAPA